MQNSIEKLLNDNLSLQGSEILPLYRTLISDVSDLVEASDAGEENDPTGVCGTDVGNKLENEANIQAFLNQQDLIASQKREIRKVQCISLKRAMRLSL